MKNPFPALILAIVSLWSSTSVAEYTSQYISAIWVDVDGTITGRESAWYSDGGPVVWPEGTWCNWNASPKEFCRSMVSTTPNASQEVIAFWCDWDIRPHSCAYLNHGYIRDQWTKVEKNTSYYYHTCMPYDYNRRTCRTKEIVQHWAAASCRVTTGGESVDLGAYRIRSGRHAVLRPNDLILYCNGGNWAKVTASTESDTLGIKLSEPNGWYQIKADVGTPVGITYSIDTNVRTAGMKSHNVIYLIEFE